MFEFLDAYAMAGVYMLMRLCGDAVEHWAIKDNEAKILNFQAEDLLQNSHKFLKDRNSLKPKNHPFQAKKKKTYAS